MKKAAIIGIGIAIVIAGVAGIYAISVSQDDTPAEEASIGLKDEAEATIEEPPQESPIGLKDEAEATIEEPEEELPPDHVEATVEDKFGFSDEQP